MKKILKDIIFTPRLGICICRFKPLPEIQLNTYKDVCTFFIMNLIPYLPSTELSKWETRAMPRKHRTRTDPSRNPRVCYTVIGLSSTAEQAKHEQLLADLHLESCYTPRQITELLRKGAAIDMELAYVCLQDWYTEYIWYEEGT